MRWLTMVVALIAATAHADTSKLALTSDVTVLAFGSAACEPCRAEKPMLDALAKKYAGDRSVRVVELSVDDDAGAHDYARLFGGGEISVPRLAVVDRKAGGLQRMGARAVEKSDDFLREVSAAIEAVRKHSDARPSPLWQPLHAR